MGLWDSLQSFFRRLTNRQAAQLPLQPGTNEPIKPQLPTTQYSDIQIKPVNKENIDAGTKSNIQVIVTGSNQAEVIKEINSFPALQIETAKEQVKEETKKGKGQLIIDGSIAENLADWLEKNITVSSNAKYSDFVSALEEKKLIFSKRPERREEINAQVYVWWTGDDSV